MKRDITVGYKNSENEVLYITMPSDTAHEKVAEVIIEEVKRIEGDRMPAFVRYSIYMHLVAEFEALRSKLNEQ